MQAYDVSVIVPIYNAEKYLEQCIESILHQTKNHIQLVLVNDGSTDRSKKIIQSYVVNNTDIVYVENQNHGLIQARITGLNHASGEYIGWVDSDDFIAPDMFEKLYQLAIENDADVAYCDYYFYPKKVSSKEKWFKEYHGVKDWMFLERNTQCWNKIIKKDYLESIHLIDLFTSLDEYANLAVFLNTDRIVYTTDALYYYRVGIQSVSGGSYRGKTERFEYAAGCAKKLKENLLCEQTQFLSKYLDYRYIYCLLQLMVVAAINGNKDAYQRGKEKLILARYKENPYTKTILDYNHGKKKSFVLRSVIPLGYTIARLITSIVY